MARKAGGTIDEGCERAGPPDALPPALCWMIWVGASAFLWAVILKLV